jgi:hypothetical protein
MADKKALAVKLWVIFEHLRIRERIDEIVELLSVSVAAVERWTKDTREAEKLAAQDRAYDLWLDCYSQRAIAETIGKEYPAFADTGQKTINDWLERISANADFRSPPASLQHFDVWSFAKADKDAGAQSYFGALPPQIVENLLWYFTKAGQIVFDPFAGGGTVIDVAKTMGRRVWASDIQGDHYSPHLPIHKYDILAGWPDAAPKKADFVFLDPPYWQQAKGRYSQEPGEMAEMNLDAFRNAWTQAVNIVTANASLVAYIISPTQTDDGVIDHATEMLTPFLRIGWHVKRRVIVPYQTQQATGQQVEWARANQKMLKLYRDLIVLSKEGA